MAKFVVRLTSGDRFNYEGDEADLALALGGGGFLNYAEGRLAVNSDQIVYVKELPEGA